MKQLRQHAFGRFLGFLVEHLPGRLKEGKTPYAALFAMLVMLVLWSQ